MTRTHSRRCGIVALPLLLATGLGTLPAAAAPLTSTSTSTSTTVSVEGERFALAASNGQVFGDSTASGGAGLLIWSNGTATTTVTASGPSTRLNLVVRGDQCNGAPAASVRVDGALVASTTVPSSAWTTLTASGTWSTGTHQVAVSFTNDVQAPGCDRNLRVDRLLLTGAPMTTSANPLQGVRLYVDPGSQARQEMTRRAGDTAAVAALRKIAEQPGSLWLGDWVPTSQVRTQVAARTTAAANAGSVASIVLYAIPGRDCGSYSAGGLSGPTAYAAWVREVAAGIGTRRTVVVVEPDALAQMDCLSTTARTQRSAMLRDALSALRTAAPGAVTYLDGGNSGWVPSDVMAARLRDAGVANARGFSVNVSNFNRTADEVGYGNRVAAATGGAHFVVDTSRNGLGPLGGALGWCNPAGRALGDRPTTSTASAAADAYLWIKMVGQSDGDCGRGEPAAGTWWPEYAIGLGSRALW
jgi:endoglucanase